MKKLIYISLLLCGQLTFGQSAIITSTGPTSYEGRFRYALFLPSEIKDPVLKTSPLGIQYWVSIPSTPGKYPIVFYACGGGGNPENPQSSVFYKQFLPSNKEKFICVAIVMPSGRTGWDYPVDATKTKAGAYLARYIFNTYNSQSNGKFHGGGWSAGASYNFWYECRDFLTTLTICAGLGDMNTIREFGKSKIPGRHYNGTNDSAIPISKVEYAVTQYGPTMSLIEISGGGHSSAPAKAYAAGEDLADWYLSFSPPKVPPVIVPDTIVNIIMLSDTLRYIGKSGKVYKH